MDNFKLMVCPHDTAGNPERWYYLTQYLSSSLDTHISFEPYLDFEEFHENMAQADLIYANPQDGVKLIDEHGFKPLVRPSNLFDEVIFLANEDVENPTLESLEGQVVASVMSMLPTNIGLYVLDKLAIHPAEMSDRNSWLAVVHSVIEEDVLYGFIYKDTYDSLSPMSKEMVNAFYTSEEKLAFHSLNIGKQLFDKAAALTDLLLAMHTTDAGPQVLAQLDVESWVKIDDTDIDKIKQIIRNYG